MALDQKEFLLSEANVIRHEADDGKNTAERIGKMFVDLINGVSESATDIEQIIETAIGTERSQRQAADTALSRGITNEAGARQAADQSLQLAIDSEAGEREDADNALRALIDEMGVSLWPVEIEMAASSTLMEYQQAGREVTVSGNIKRKGASIPAADLTSVKLKVDSNTPIVLPANPVFSQDLTLTTLGANTITLLVTAYGVTTSKSVTVNLERKMYFGFSSVQTSANVELDSLTQQPVALSPKGDYSMNNPATGNYLWLCVPKRMTITKVTSSGFAVPMETPVETGNYKYYRSSSAIVAGQMNFSIE